MDDLLFKQAMSKFATGVTVITTSIDGQAHGMTANAFMSVSLDPKLVLISIHEKARMNKLIETSQKFAVSILAEGQEGLSMHFAGQIKAGKEIEFDELDELPIVPGAIAHIACKVHNAHIEGDHTLYIGEVTGIQLTESEPLGLFGGKYKKVVNYASQII